MTKKTAVLLLLASLAVPAAAPTLASGQGDFWDHPKIIAKTTDARVKADVKSVDLGGRVLVFYLLQGPKSAEIAYVSTEEFRTFSPPAAAKKGIELKPGFSPHFDVLLAGGVLFLAWNSLDGAILLSTSGDGGETWTKERVLVREKSFCFAPRLFFEQGAVFLFYHTESEGSRIDFFYIESRDMGSAWKPPFQIAKRFAGSFFPVLRSKKNELYVVWQSRPFSQNETPVFSVYLSRSPDGAVSWSAPVQLTENVVGEHTRPTIGFTEKGFFLVWESERGEASGIYVREFDPGGIPLSGETKVQGTISSARDPKVVLVGSEPLIFYLDGRGGAERLYYSKRANGGFVETGPLGVLDATAPGGQDIIHYDPILVKGQLFLFWQEKGSIVFLGPDRGVSPVKVVTAANQTVGKGGITIRWEEVKDSSGLEGYAYSFGRKESEEPEIVNLTPFTTSVSLKLEKDGAYFFHIRARDRAGNYSKTVSIAFTADLTPPPAPVLASLKGDAKGFYRDNSPVFQWTVDAPDVEGFNYAFSKKPATITTPRVRTAKRKAVFRSVEGGTWFFNIAAVDRAGNIGETASVQVRLRPLPKAPAKEKPPEVKTVRLAPPWIMKKETFKAHPAINISLYLVLLGLCAITFFLFVDIFFRLISPKEGTKMEETSVIRKKRFGLRFKFSLLIAALILILTVGISTVLSSISIESQRRALAAQMMDKARLTMESTTNVAREGILNNDDLLLLTVITKTMENKDIMFSVILDRENRVVAHSDMNEQGKILSDELTLKSLETNNVLVLPDFSPDKLAPLYTLTSPVVFSGRRIGTVELGYSTESIFKTIEEARRRNIYSSAIVTVATILFGIVGAIFMATITIRPIKVLAEGANIIGSGRLDYKIHIKAQDEIGLLSDEFNRMTERLLGYQKRMEEKAKLDEQLEIARNIQQSLIPQTGIESDRVSIGGYYKAAAGVGGDYYDFIQIDGGRYGLIMSDVAGKGVPASLMMIMIRTVFKSLVQSGVSEPGRLVTLMNSTLASDISSDRFATLLFGVYNQENRSFRYTNAGYGPLLVYKRARNKCFLVNPPQGSVPVGVMPDVDYVEEKPIKLDPGDSVFLFTDGIHEARNERKEEYGMGRLSSVIPGFADKDSKEISNLIIQNVVEFMGGAEQYDDMTLSVMKIK